MRRITKGPEPEDLRCWKEENALTPQILVYSNMPKPKVKAWLLIEQGHLCAYTMQRISTVDDCHIEHIVPRSQPGQPEHLDITYDNLLACVPSDTPGHRPLLRPFPYGAVKKDDTPVDESNFVSPLQEDVEERFQYASDGSVTCAATDVPARSTIKMLRLDHDQLCALRKAGIEERVLDVDLTAEEAELLSRSIMSEDANGEIAEFCLAISQVAASYAKKLRGVA
jgi:uncharacterized protein (TIGR02646 family)